METRHYCLESSSSRENLIESLTPEFTWKLQKGSSIEVMTTGDDLQINVSHVYLLLSERKICNQTNQMQIIVITKQEQKHQVFSMVLMSPVSFSEDLAHYIFFTVLHFFLLLLFFPLLFSFITNSEVCEN